MGLELADMVLVMIGRPAIGSAPSDRYHFEGFAVHRMITDSFQGDERARILTSPIFDIPNDDVAWAEKVRWAIHITRPIGRAVMIGHNKPDTKFRHLFRNEFVMVDVPPDDKDLSGTQIRELLRSGMMPIHAMPHGTVKELSTHVKDGRI